MAWRYPVQEELKVTPRQTCSAPRTGSGPQDHGARIQQAKNEPWVGVAIAEVFGVDLERSPTKRQVARLVQDWIAMGWLRRVEMRDGRRNPRGYVEAGDDPVG